MGIEVSNLTKVYGTQRAVDNVSFSIGSGEIVGFIGPNGAGKSTTMKVLTGYIQNYDGQVLVDGLDLRDNLQDIKRKIGYLPEHNPLYLEMYVREYLYFIAGIYRIKNCKARVDAVIQLTGLELEYKKKIQALSKGYRQRVGLATALLPDPSFLILDEPTTGLDPNQIIEIRNVIASVGKEKTVLLSTHLMQEVEAICNRVIVINKGTIVANDGTNEVKSSVGTTVSFFVEFAELVNVDLLRSIAGIETLEMVSKREILVHCKPDVDPRKDIFKFAVQSNNPILVLQQQTRSMEDAFRALTNNN